MVTGTLADMIESQYHSMGELMEKMSAAAVGVQGSGWGWLGYDKVNKRLAITTCANQVRVDDGQRCGERGGGVWGELGVCRPSVLCGPCSFVR